LEIDLEAKLYRLTILVSIFLAIGFGIAGISSNSKADSFHQMLSVDKTMYELGQKTCQGLSDQVLKDECLDKGENNYMDSMVLHANSREEATRRGDNFISAAVCIPLGLFILFFSARWIIIGKIRKPLGQFNGG
jgi:hypothetical protein